MGDQGAFSALRTAALVGYSTVRRGTHAGCAPDEPPACAGLLRPSVIRKAGAVLHRVVSSVNALLWLVVVFVRPALLPNVGGVCGVSLEGLGRSNNDVVASLVRLSLVRSTTCMRERWNVGTFQCSKRGDKD